MRDNLPFDDFVKKQFNAYSPVVPGHILENIISAKRKSKPKGFWMNMFRGSNLLIFGLILFIGGGTSYFLLSSDRDNSSAKNIVTPKSISSSQTVNTSPEKNLSEDKPTSPGYESATSSNKFVEEEKNITDVISDEISITPGNSSNRNNIYTLSNRKRGIKNADDNKDNAADQINKNGLSIAEDNKELTNTKLFSPFRFNNARELSGTGTLDAEIKLPDCPAIEKDAAGNKKYWEVYAGPDYAFESYKSYDDTASINYLQKRKASTKFASAFSAGVRYTKVFNNGTSV
ncbi:MAG: hypothetical protein ACR2KX_14300, partial [Chitinophagaceae bacterium]